MQLQVPTKICAKCKEEKLYIEFAQNKKTPDKLEYRCKKCVKECVRSELQIITSNVHSNRPWKNQFGSGFN